MRLRIRDLTILGVFALATGMACGGRTSELFLPGQLGPGDDDGGSSSGSSGVTSSSGITSSSGVTSSSGINSSSGSSGSSNGSVSSSTSSSGVAEDVSCTPNAVMQGFASSLASCWGCATDGCAAQFEACTQDCDCNAAIVKALDCVDPARDNALTCFMSAFNADSTTMSLVSCLSMVGNECGCLGTVPPPDASTCVASGSSSSGGSGECTSDFGETCNGTEYKVVCTCPQNQCVCFGPSATTIVNVNTCPLCPGLGGTSESQVLDACGFPH